MGFNQVVSEIIPQFLQANSELSTIALDAKTVTAIVASGLLVIFSVLALFVIIFKAMGLVIAPASKVTKSTPPSKPIVTSAPQVSIDNGIEEEIVAVIMASIYKMCSEDGINNFTIKSIKKSQNAPISRPAWAQAGINQNVQPF